MADLSSPIPLLQGTANYLDWSLRMRNELEHRELWAYVCGKAPFLPDNASAVRDSSQPHPDVEAHHLLVTHLDRAPFEEVITTRPSLLSASDLWTALRHEYGPHRPSQRNEAIAKLVALKWMGPEAVSLRDHASYFFRIYSTLQMLAEADGAEPIPEWMGIGLLLSSAQGVHEAHDKTIFNVLRHADLRKKKVADIVADMGGYGMDFKKLLEAQRSDMWLGFDPSYK
jgi:hypothetical protein